MSKSIIAFSQQNREPTYDRPRPDRLVAGNPLRTTHEYFTAPAGDCSSGIWACEVGRWRIAFSSAKDEFFCVISGRVRLHDSAGECVEVGPGEAAVIPAGFEGEFEVVEPVRKYFVVIERAA